MVLHPVRRGRAPSADPGARGVGTDGPVPGGRTREGGRAAAGHRDRDRNWAGGTRRGPCGAVRSRDRALRRARGPAGGGGGF
ncbi:hypothetical protein DDE05_22225, partial [Streptomyces cavourensis]